MSAEAKAKIALFCNVRKDAVIEAIDVTNIYEVPLVLHRQGLDRLVIEMLGLKCREPKLEAWTKFVEQARNPAETIEIALVGKYVGLHDAYKSVIEALMHAGVANKVGVKLRWLESEAIDQDSCHRLLDGLSGVVVPGGFGVRGMEGKMEAIRYCREKGLPYLGLCVGLHCAVAEFARDVCGLEGADSTEFNPKTKLPGNLPDAGATRRQGQRRHDAAGRMADGSETRESGCEMLWFRQRPGEGLERHRHRYEVNPSYLPVLEKHGLIASGKSPDGRLVEVVELRGHPFFIATQAHPEFKSRPLRPHPLFSSFVQKAHEYSRRRSQTG